MRTYTKAFKQKVIQEVLNGASKEAVRKRYGIKGSSAILNWMRKLGAAETVPLPSQPFEMEERDNLTPAELRKKIKQLERALEDEQLKAEAYRRIIEKADEQLGTDLGKKSGTK